MSTVMPSKEETWTTLLETLQFAQDHFERWKLASMIPKEFGDEVISALRKQLEQYKSMSSNTEDAPTVDGIIPATNIESPDISAFRCWKFLEYKIIELKLARKLSLSQLHALQTEIDERLYSISRRLSEIGIPVSSLAAASLTRGLAVDEDSKLSNAEERTGKPHIAGYSATATGDARFIERQAEIEDKNFVSGRAKGKLFSVPQTELPRRNLLELLLDPTSIQWLLGLGGGLMVVGLVILLWLNDFFTPPVMAVGLGLINLAVLAIGTCLIQFTRYQFAGKALMLFACLVMPLNLWYYSANSLITLDGHLWVAAVVISAIYAASALLLKDQKFVYIFCAGIAMTGLLMLADIPPSPQKFWEIPYPATLLVVLGLISIHAERAFVDAGGPFSRKHFGLAFFWSGHVQLAAGLLLVLGAQLAGDWLYDLWFKPVFTAWNTTPSPLCGELRWFALVLVLLATYACVYSDLVVCRAGIFIHIAAFMLLWAEILVVQMLHLELGVDAVISVLALTSLIVHVVQASISGDSKYTRSFPVFGLLLGLLPVLLGGLVYFQHVGPRFIWTDQPPQWTFVGAMLLTAVASRVGAHVYQHASKPLTMSYYFASGASVMVAAAAASAASGVERWEEHAPILMLIPIGYMIASQLYGDHLPAEPLRWVAHAATIAMLATSMTSAFEGFSRLEKFGPLNLSLALFFFEAALFYGLAAWLRNQPRLVYLTTLMASASLWQLLAYLHIGTQGFILAFAVIGLLLKIAYRLSIWERTGAATLSEPFFTAANTLLSLAFVSSVFQGLSGLVTTDYYREGVLTTAKLDWEFVGFCMAMLLVSALALMLTRHRDWRRWYIVTTLAEAAVTLFAIHRLIDLNPWQQIELFAVLVGLALLAVGHVGWYREQDRESDVVSTSLMIGALLASCPLAIATWYDRYHSQFFFVNEFGFLFVSVLLLTSGLVFQLKSTTLVGGCMSTLYFLTLLILVPWSQLNSVAIAITVGGGIIFGFGLLLAFFRDQILELPKRLKQREGLFRILNWR